MEIIYRKAVPNDLDEISELIKRAVKAINLAGIHQWDDIYPARDDFKDDIEKGHAYVGTIDDKIAVYYAISKEYDEQYENGDWTYTGDDFIVIHRLCVSPAYQNMGIAKHTLSHIESESIVKGAQAVKLDVFTENPMP